MTDNAHSSSLRASDHGLNIVVLVIMQDEGLTEVAEILLRLQDNLAVNPKHPYTTRTVTGRLRPTLLLSYCQE